MVALSTVQDGQYFRYSSFSQVEQADPDVTLQTANERGYVMVDRVKGYYRVHDPVVDPYSARGRWVPTPAEAQVNAGGSDYQKTVITATQPITLTISNDDLADDEAKTIVLWVIDPNRTLRLASQQDPTGSFSPPSGEYTIVLEHRGEFLYVR